MRAERFLPILLVILLLIGALFAVYCDRGPAGVFTKHTATLDAAKQESFSATFRYLDFGSGELAEYTATEKSHLQDVRLLLIIGFALFLATLIATIIIISRSKKEKVKRAFFLAGIITVVIALLLATAAFFDFTAFWSSFHRIFFPQGNWQFAQDSLLIQLFTEEFFMNCATNYVLALGSFGIVGIIVGWMKRKLTHLPDKRQER